MIFAITGSPAPDWIPDRVRCRSNRQPEFSVDLTQLRVSLVLKVVSDFTPAPIRLGHGAPFVFFSFAADPARSVYNGIRLLIEGNAT